MKHIRKGWHYSAPNTAIGRPCLARYNSGFVIGKIAMVDHKSGLCTVDTEKLGKIKAKIAFITMLDKEYD